MPIAALTPSPTPSPVAVSPDAITPGVLGFVAILAIAVVTVLLIVDMNRRIRRTRYRAQIAERRRRRWVVGGALVLAAAALVAAWSIWTGVGGSIGTLQTSTLGFAERGDTAVTVSWEVDGLAGERLLCDIEGQDDSGAVVGLKEVLLPVTGDATRTGRTTVRTVRAADTGLIRSCRRA